MRTLLPILCLCLITACQCGDPDGNVGDDGGDDHPQQDGGQTDGGQTGDDGGTTQACIPGAQSLQVGPDGQTVTVTSSGPTTVSFTATAALSGGGSLEATRRVTWSVTRSDDSPAGTISADGVYTPAPGVGGVVTLSATDGCVSGSASLTLKLSATVGSPPQSTVDRFNGTVDTTTSAKLPRVVYPHNQTRFPRNIYKVLFQWQKGGNESFRLTFEGPYSTTTIYTDGAHPDCANTTTAACWEADANAWLAIAGSNAGATTRLTVDGVSASDTHVYRAPPIDLSFSKRDVRGAIFYWSTTAAGVRRASVSDNAPEAYVVAKPVPTTLPNSAVVKCVACHTVSRSGKKLFGGTQTSSATGEFVYDVALQPPPTPVITTQISTANKGFGTFSPDDKRVVATVGTKLAEFDSSTGAKIADLPIAAGTNPDWSPTGTELVYSNVGGDSPGNAALGVVAHAATGAWGSTRVLVPAGGLSNLFPSYAPDGQAVVYARGKGGHGDKTLQLFLTKADGTGQPVELLTANRAVNNCLGVTCDARGLTNGQYENNMPTWAPPGDTDWVAFNSLRPYGVVYPSGGTQQIWVAAIDRSKLGQTYPDGGVVDPSYPAFRFAFQDLNENNHRAFWTLDVRVPEPTDGGACTPSGAECGPNTTCCQGLQCQPASELTYFCQAPSSNPDAGACLSDGTTCDQSTGAACCSGLVCDVAPSGNGTTCHVILN
ncbi:MAG: hypothetical protein ACJ8AT_21050 [Hyalangium sp.]|uniref:hypothetical protein n=1 Tax=Hyalangium sp. TaxID=2028555 RepID=UPI003899DA1E